MHLATRLQPPCNLMRSIKGHAFGITFLRDSPRERKNLLKKKRKKKLLCVSLSLRTKCPYLELFWSIFSRIRSEYGEILCISPCSVRMRRNADQNNSEYGYFLRGVKDKQKQDYYCYFRFNRSNGKKIL